MRIEAQCQQDGINPQSDAEEFGQCARRKPNTICLGEIRCPRNINRLCAPLSTPRIKVQGDLQRHICRNSPDENRTIGLAIKADAESLTHVRDRKEWLVGE